MNVIGEVVDEPETFGAPDFCGGFLLQSTASIFSWWVEC